MKVIVNCSKMLVIVLFYLLFFIFLVAIGHFVREIFAEIENVMVKARWL